MQFLDALKLTSMLAEGAVVERLRRNPRIALDPHLEHAGLIYTPHGAAALELIYREYLGIATEAELPIVCFSPTWRANPERLRASSFAERDVNGDGVRFLRSIAADYPGGVFVGGLLGCYGDAYKPEEALSEVDAEAFHAEQAQSLAAARPDFIFAATLPAASEATGIARALAGCGLPYVLSFLIGTEGALLDGTPVRELIARIDSEVDAAPAAYFVNCVHPSVLAAALAAGPVERLAGLQANTSRRNPHEREGLPEVDSEDPETFADAMLGLHLRFNIRILGGCCGTDGAHIRAMARRLRNRREKHSLLPENLPRWPES